MLAAARAGAAEGLSMETIKRTVHEVCETAIGLKIPAKPTNGPLARMPLRQFEIGYGAAAGLSNKEIANHLEISEATVKVHMKAAFKLLDVDNRSSLARIFNDAGMTFDRDRDLLERSSITVADLRDDERDLIKLLADGKTDEEIAAILSTSVPRTKGRVRCLLARLNTNNRTSAARWWFAANKESDR
ncbi:LuxR C-terminal-related transcriptional regulator [Azospirillum sp. HJ39]|uniref:LuxR C-terminal-related transcriptional regulator n=1 Tax=Azospirillum sp. HJ39 TaxID=3159496 RepID=UPI003556FCD2